MTTAPMDGARPHAPSRDVTLPGLIEARVRAAPEDIALLTDTRAVGFGSLNVRANRLAHLLIELGAGPEHVVGVALPRSIEGIIALVAVLKTGAVYLPLNPAYPAERTAFMLADAAPVALLTDAEAGVTPPPATRLLLWDELDTGPYPGTDPTDAERTRPLRSAHPLYLIYTSGSTGVPKGVLMPGASLVNLLAWHAAHLPVGPGVRTAQLTALAFDMSMHEVLSTLVHGRTLVIPAEELRLDPIRLARWLDRHRVNQIFLPNVLLEALCEAAEVAGIGLDALTDIVQSGEALALGVGVRRFLRRHPGLRLRNHYGATEMQDVTAWTTDAEPSGPPTIGRPLWNTRVYVLDEDLRAVPDGTAGDLHVAGVGLARGYLNRPATTAERFLPDPFGRPGERMYRTGDVARWTAGGELEHLGRSDNQVKVHGFRVELGEIEARLHEQPDVAKAVVLPREHPPGRKLLVGYVVPAAGARLEPDVLRERLARVLPTHMVPAAFVVLAALPLAPNGKIDLRALPVPEVTAADADAETPGQRVLMDAFSAVLGARGVGPDDDFLTLGGDSIAAVRLVIRTRRDGLAISTREVFELGTPRRLAGAAGAAPAAEGQGPRRPLISLHQRHLARLQAVRPDIESLLPVTPLQQGFLFHRLRGEGGFDVYAEQVVLQLGGPLDGAALHAAARALLGRHEALRAGFHVDGIPQPVQLVAAEVDLPWKEADLSRLTPAAAAEEAQRLTERQRRRFDVRTPPLLRFQLIRLPRGEYLLAMAYHHILLDGWSVSLLVRELFALYRRPGGLPPAPSYRDWLRSLPARDHAAAERAWRETLGGVPGPAVLAPGGADRPAPPSKRHVIDLPAEVTTRLAAFGRRDRLTVNTMVLAMWGVLLGAETGTRDVVFGTTVSGRTPEVPEVEDMVGLLINTVPVLVRLRPGDTARTLLRGLQDDQQRLAPHQHLGLGAIQRLLGWSTEFDTLLVFENPALQLPVGDSGPIKGVEFGDDTFYTISVVASLDVRLRLRLSLTYRPDLLDAERVRSLADRLAALLSAVADDPRVRVDDLAGGRFSEPSASS